MTAKVRYCIEFGKCDTTDWIEADVEVPPEVAASGANTIVAYAYDEIEDEILSKATEEDVAMFEEGGWIIRVELAEEE